jgi:hypothetical protein
MEFLALCRLDSADYPIFEGDNGFHEFQSPRDLSVAKNANCSKKIARRPFTDDRVLKFCE